MNESNEFLNVNKHQLDEEWCKQPKLYHSYATDLAEARQNYAECKAELDVVRAQTDNSVRIRLEKKGEKITETIVANKILLREEYKAALSKLHQAKFAVDMLEAAVEALDHKKKALESLVYLHGQDYFSEPHARGNIGEAMQEAEEKELRKRGQRPRKTKGNGEE